MDQSIRWRNDVNRFPAGMKTGSNVWYADSVSGSDDNTGTRPELPFATIAKVITRASAGDYVFVMPGHTETVATAGGLTFSVANLFVEFLGSGSNKATITFTATGATLVVSAAGVTLLNPRFLTGIDAVAAAINVQAADFKMQNVEYYDATSKSTTIQVLTTSAANRMIIDGYQYYESTGGTQKTDGIKTAGALNGVVLKNINITGDFSTSPVDISAAITNINLYQMNLNNLNASPAPGLTLHANTTGFAEDVKLRIASGTTYVSSQAKLQWGMGCLGYASDGTGGSALGAATDITAAVNSVGVQASVVQSKADSVGVGVSTNTSGIGSVGVSISTNTSLTQSVGVQASTIQSYTYSVGQQASLVSVGTSTVDSKLVSVGATASINTSAIGSVGVAVSTNTSLTSSTGVAVVSVGTNLSTNVSRVISVGTGLSTGLSQLSSIGIQTSAAAANVLSVASQATSITAQVSTTQSSNLSVLSSVGTQVSTTSSSGISQGTSIGVATSQIQSTLISIGLVISYIKSKCG